MKKCIAIGGIVVFVIGIAFLLWIFLGNRDTSVGNKTYKGTISREDSSLSFYDTIELPETNIINEVGVKYGKYDIFKDDKEKEYVFVHEEDIYCGFRTLNTDSSEATIEEDGAKEIATEYLKKEVSNSSVYQLEDTVYQEWNYSYLVRFRHYIEEIPTEEVVEISVGGNGIVNSYSNFMAGCFDQTSVDAGVVKEAMETIKGQLEKEYTSKNYKINEQGITYQDGKLVLKTAYFYKKEQGDGASIMMDNLIYTPLS